MMSPGESGSGQEFFGEIAARAVSIKNLYGAPNRSLPGQAILLWHKPCRRNLHMMIQPGSNDKGTRHTRPYRDRRFVFTMKRIHVSLGIVFVFLASAALGGQEKREFASYKEMREYLGELFQQEKYTEAASLLESVLDRFPDNVEANTYNLALARLSMGDNEKAVEALEEGHRRGIFYGIWYLSNKRWDPLKGLPRFEAVIKENQTRVAMAQKRASMKIETATPAGYVPDKKYPLFIALHGGGESVADFKPSWTSPRLRGEFITVYVQSSQVASMTGFHWQDVAITRKELEAAYRQTLEQYPVDADRVIIGGFSSGGFGSLAVALKNDLPVRGFVVLCPEVPTMISDEDILGAKIRGLRGTLLTTEADNRVEQQRALMERLEKSGLAVDFHLTPAIGHWYPKDFEALLDRAIGNIFQSGKSESNTSKETFP
jgi:predicted esterase